MSLFDKILLNIKNIYTKHFLQWTGVRIVLSLIIAGIALVVILITGAIVWLSSPSTTSAAEQSDTAWENFSGYDIDDTDTSFSGFAPRRDTLQINHTTDYDHEEYGLIGLIKYWGNISYIGWIGIVIGGILLLVIFILGTTFFVVGIIRLNIAYQRKKTISLSDISRQSIGRLFRQSMVGVSITLLIILGVGGVILLGSIIGGILGLIHESLSLIVMVISVIAGVIVGIRFSLLYMLYLYPGEDTEYFGTIGASESMRISKVLMNGSIGKVFFPFIVGALIFLIPSTILESLPNIIAWFSITFGDGTLAYTINTNFLFEMICLLLSTLLFSGLMITVLTTTYLHLLEEKRHLFPTKDTPNLPPEQQNTSASDTPSEGPGLRNAL